ncbi:MAG: hypothetical protein LBI27_01420, partial [Clostridiales bacterium]|nr:hypothetical protein [Clostridiales bacterium]
MKNPIVYVFLDEVRTNVLRFAERMHPPNTVFESSLDELRETKTKIQANEGKLSLGRVNIYAVANSAASESAESYAEKIRAIFREDFAIVDMTLVVILNEGVKNFLSERETFFNRIFILSTKNEYGEILPECQKNISEIIAGLPLLHTVQSNFCDLLSAKMKERTVFASAGFWQKPQFPENRELHKLADFLEAKLKIQANEPRIGIAEPNQIQHRNSPEIAENIASVAAKPLRAWNLWGRSIKEAE